MAGANSKQVPGVLEIAQANRVAFSHSQKTTQKVHCEVFGKQKGKHTRSHLAAFHEIVGQITIRRIYSKLLHIGNGALADANSKQVPRVLEIARAKRVAFSHGHKPPCVYSTRCTWVDT